jgi:hypothetical protein
MQMIRHAVAVAFAICVSPASLYAQTAQLTVNTPSATIYKGPSVGSPVIGQAPRGAVLEVVRELGDWVKVTWPAVPDATGYVRTSAGSVTRQGSGQGVPAFGRATLDTVPMGNAATNASPTQIAGQPAPTGGAISRVMGFGGRMGGSALGFGGSLRGWSKKRIGVQVEVSRYSLTSVDAAGRVTTLEVAPSVLYALPNRVGDYVWLRPYVGAGLNLQRATQPGFGSASKTGFQAFGGGEFTFASAPRLAVSTDLGYRRVPAPYQGFDLGDMRLGISAHWYLK